MWCTPPREGPFFSVNHRNQTLILTATSQKFALKKKPNKNQNQKHHESGSEGTFFGFWFLVFALV